MNRKEFLARSSAGFAFSLIAPGMWFCNKRLPDARKIAFQPYRPGQTLGKVHQVTPDDGFYVNTYYDVCPFSPSKRYLALTRLPFQDRIARLGDIAEVVVVDLHEQTIRGVYQTKSWGYQLGANLHWGATDRWLYANDVLDGQFAVCVQLDLETGESRAFEGPVYDIDPDGGKVIGPHIEFANNSQYAYGTPSPDPENLDFATLPVDASPDDGCWETNLETGQTRLLVSLKDTAAVMTDNEEYEGSAYYFFHTKYSPLHDKIMLVVRYPVFRGMRNGAPSYHRNTTLLSCKSDGGSLQEILPRTQWNGHHPNWHTDNEHIIMNLRPEWEGDDTLRFCLIRHDGSCIRTISDQFVGSGHPSVDKTGRYILSDCYPFEPMATGNGEVPIRLIDLHAGEERAICTIFTDLGSRYDIPRYWGPSKLDAHPVWNRDYRSICFNGAPKGTRQVFVADLEGII